MLTGPAGSESLDSAVRNVTSHTGIGAVLGSGIGLGLAALLERAR